MKQIFTNKKVEESIDLTKQIQSLEDRRDGKKKSGGIHPHDTALALQKKRKERDIIVNELRNSFIVIQGGKQ